MSRVALIGLGEVGRIFAEDLGALGHALTGYDIAWSDQAAPAARNAVSLGLPTDVSVADVVAGADLVVSAVTPGSCVDVARAVAPHLSDGAWFFDLNSASPGHKVEAAGVVEESGRGRYVEAALMSAIGPRRLEAPFLLGGPWAEEFAKVAADFGLRGATVGSAVVGRAAATKLCRSVVVKGLEALFTESLTAARQHGVEADVLASLSNILPEADWESVAGYFVSRSLRHGRRRSEEMGEAAATVAEADVDPIMALATQKRQAWAGSLGLTDSEGRDLLDLLDRIRDAVTDAGPPDVTD